MTRAYLYLLWLTLFTLLFAYHPNTGSCQGAAGPALTRQDREVLRFIAQTTVERVVWGEKVPSFQITSEALKERRGVFVTLRNAGHLRGCIGCLVGTLPLCETVQKMAIQAAMSDPRFPPVTRQELPFLQIEISVLGPLRPVEWVEEIVVGTHGLLLVHENSSGVLLPQVASENGWDRKTFLESLSQKAGLPKDAWKSQESRIYLFTAEVF